MARPLGDLSMGIVEVINAWNKRGEGPTARDITGELFGDDYYKRIMVQRCLRNLKRLGLVERFGGDPRTGAEWWRPNAIKIYLRARLNLGPDDAL